MANVIRPPQRLTKAQRVRPSLFLAGPFGDVAWRDEIIAALYDLDVDVFDPRDSSCESAPVEPSPSGFQGMLGWQLSNATDADVVVIWLPQGVAAPTALLHLGFLAARRGGAKRGSSVIVGLPDAPTPDLLRTFAAQTGVQHMPDLDGVIRAARYRLTSKD